MGRQSTFNQEIADAICAEIADGKPLRQFCRENDIAWRTVYHWLEDNPEFAAHFARAREIGFDAIAEEALEIANTTQEGVRYEESETGVKQVREDMLGHRKLQIETRLKLLAKWCPKRYGEKIAQEVTGADGGPVKITSARELSDAELLEIASKK